MTPKDVIYRQFTFLLYSEIYIEVKKGKMIPLQARCGPEGG